MKFSNAMWHLKIFFPVKVESVNSRSITAPLSGQILLRCILAVLLWMVPAKLTGKTEMKRLDEEWKTFWCYAQLRHVRNVHM